MFVHIGNSRVVPLKEILGIFNMNIKNNRINVQFLESFPSEGGSDEKGQPPNAFVLTPQKIYYSPLSPQTLQRRVERNWE